jgi:hypothetical protein
VIAAVVLLGLLSVVLLGLAVAAIAANEFDPAGLLIAVAVAIFLALVAAALWQGRPGSGYAGLAVGLLLIGYGVYLAGLGESVSLELMVGIAVSVLVSNRRARAWTAGH